MTFLFTGPILSNSNWCLDCHYGNCPSWEESYSEKEEYVFKSPPHCSLLTCNVKGSYCEAGSLEEKKTKKNTAAGQQGALWDIQRRGDREAGLAEWGWLNCHSGCAAMKAEDVERLPQFHQAANEATAQRMTAQFNSSLYVSVCVCVCLCMYVCVCVCAKHVTRWQIQWHQYEKHILCHCEVSNWECGFGVCIF